MKKLRNCRYVILTLITLARMDFSWQSHIEGESILKREMRWKVYINDVMFIKDLVWWHRSLYKTAILWSMVVHVRKNVLTNMTYQVVKLLKYDIESARKVHTFLVLYIHFCMHWSLAKKDKYFGRNQLFTLLKYMIHILSLTERHVITFRKQLINSIYQPAWAIFVKQGEICDSSYYSKQTSKFYHSFITIQNLSLLSTSIW
jgi:hypothetical protein